MTGNIWAMTKIKRRCVNQERRKQPEMPSPPLTGNCFKKHRKIQTKHKWKRLPKSGVKGVFTWSNMLAY
jgi:hypothetical protein